MPIELVIFDCDGVLVDSEPLANAVLRDALADEGLALSLEEVVDRYVGRSMTSVVASIEKELGRALAPEWLDALQERTFAVFRESLQPVGGSTRRWMPSICRPVSLRAERTTRCA